MSIASSLQARKYNVTSADVARLGGVWNDEEACFEFPDGSAGNFTDLRNGTAERTLSGEPLLRFQELQ